MLRRGGQSVDPSGPQPVSTVTGDGVRLSGLYFRGPAVPVPTDPAFVVCHGLSNSTADPAARAIMQTLARSGAVFAFDFRGHGGSGGRSTVGRDEVRDVDAAIAYARAAGHPRVAVIGFSMGGAVTLRHAGTVRHDPLLDHRPDVVVSVSAPARWFLRESRFMLRVQWLLEHPLGPLVGIRIGIRLGAPWPEVPSCPLEDVADIAPVPLLLVHGTADHYFPPDQARMLHRAAPGSELWLIDGMRHGESGVSPETVSAIAAWCGDPALRTADDPVEPSRG